MLPVSWNLEVSFAVLDFAVLNWLLTYSLMFLFISLVSIVLSFHFFLFSFIFLLVSSLKSLITFTPRVSNSISGIENIKYHWFQLLRDFFWRNHVTLPFHVYIHALQLVCVLD